jgi:hypothetical protein
VGRFKLKAKKPKNSFSMRRSAETMPANIKHGSSQFEEPGSRLIGSDYDDEIYN